MGILHVTGIRDGLLRRIFGPLCMAVIAISVLLLSEIGYVKRAEHWTADWRTALFSTHYPSQHEAVALVLITEETLEDYPVRIPIDRAMIAKVIRSIASAHPAAIGIDFVFARPTTPSADAELLSAIRDADVPIVLGAADERMRLTEKQLQYHRQFLSAANRPTGHIFFERKTNTYGISDRVIREMPESAGSGDGQSLAEVLAQIKQKDAKPHTTRIDWLLPPRDASETFYEVDAIDLLGSPEDVEPFLPGLKDKIVLIGADLVDLDRHLTPLSVVDESRMPGVKIHAQIIAQLIDDRWLRELYKPEELLMLLAIVFVAYAASRHPAIGKFKGTLAWAGSTTLVLSGFFVFSFLGLVLPYATGLVAWITAVKTGPNVERYYQKLTGAIRFISAKGARRWNTYYRLGSTLGSRLWRERL